MNKKLYDRPIAFQRIFVELTGSINGALLLSQACYWSQRTKSEDGWFYKTQEEWEEETGMSRYELEGARKSAQKYLKVELRGLPAKNHYFVDFDLIDTDCGKQTIQFGENQQTGLGKTSKHSISENTTENTTAVNEFLGFPLPEEWSDESYVDSDGNYIPRFKDEYGRPIKQSEIKIMAKKYQTAQKAQKTKAVNSEFATKAVKILQQKQGIYKLDGGDNVKYANEFREMFKDHLKKDFGIEADDEKALQNYEKFLDLVVEHPFHGRNATSMGYLVRNFNKIIRDIKK